MKSVDDGDGDVYGNVVGLGKWRADKPSLYFRCLEEMLHSGTCPLAGGGAVKKYAATRISLLAALGGFTLDPESRANRSIDEAPLEISFSIRRI